MVLTVLFVFLLFCEGVYMKTAALAVFLLAAFTDYWDGKIARERGLITPLGQLLDPIADKFLTLSAFISFARMRILPAWMVLIIILRDVLVTAFRLSIPEKKAEKTEARQSGKQKTVLQFVSIVTILIFLILRETSFWRPEWTPNTLLGIKYLVFIIVAVTVWSGVRYLVKNRQFFPK